MVTQKQRRKAGAKLYRQLRAQSEKLMREQFPIDAPDDSYAQDDAAFDSLQAMVDNLHFRIVEMGKVKGKAYDAAERAALAALKKLHHAVVPAPPRFIEKSVVRLAGDHLDRNAAAMKKKGARHSDHYGMNQLAHWLWHLAGAGRAP